MIQRLSSNLFIAMALLLMGAAQLPVIRYLLGRTETIEMQFLTVVYLLIAGLMVGLTGMLLILKRQDAMMVAGYADADSKDNKTAALMHASGLLLYTGIPLINFLAAYYLWLKHKDTSLQLDKTGREVLCYQVTIFLYLLLALFLVIAVIGLMLTPLVFALHLLTSVVAISMTLQGKSFTYPANISIMDRMLDS